MKVTIIDWSMVIIYFIFTLVIGLYYSKRAGKNIVEFFVSGRNLPWWIAGTSMVATTFAADTPLAVCGMVGNYGIAGNWLWWNFVMSGLLTVFIFARLWRRAEILTDVEFTELRYSGKPAAILRGFRSLYLAIPINCIVMGWINLAMAKIIGETLGIEKWIAIAICLGITVLYAMLAGMWGVVITGFYQFFFAMGGTIILAVYALDVVGGISGLKEGLNNIYGENNKILEFFPRSNAAWMPISTFLVYLSVNWWATWYPGAEPGGGGYIAQRLFSAKNEKHSIFSALWFNIAHYTLRPWPWIIVGLAAMVLYPGLADKELGYVKVMIDHLPTGLRGLLLATFAAAYMSTISAQINWGTSYIINDIYKRFVLKSASEKHYVLVSRIATLIMVILGGIITLFLGSVEGAWKILISIGAGTGAVYILRWYWWRINAWSEISAMSAALASSLFLQFYIKLSPDNPYHFTKIILITTGITTAVWLIVTYLTKPVSEEVLIKFYKKIQSGGRLWKPISDKIPELKVNARIGRDLLDWFLGSVFIYCVLFGFGKFIFGDMMSGFIYILIAVVTVIIIYKDLSSRNWGVL